MSARPASCRRVPAPPVNASAAATSQRAWRSATVVAFDCCALWSMPRTSRGRQRAPSYVVFLKGAESNRGIQDSEAV